MIWLEAMAAALVGIALLLVVLGPLISRELVPALVDDEPQDLEETPKGIALSALKEIEFDQATGKLSDEDYAMLKGKYTAQALEALRAEDVGPGSGDLAQRRTIVRIDAPGVAPDGLTVDDRGDIWVALWGGGELRRYRPDGTLLTSVAVPVERPTSCAFGGPDRGAVPRSR